MAWEIEKDVLYPGKVVVPGPDGKPIAYTITPRDIQDVVRNGNAKLRDGWNVPLVWEHQNERPDRRKMLQLSQSERDREYARGVFGCSKRYRVAEDGSVKVVLAGDDDDDLKQFQKVKFVSPELDYDWLDTDGKRWPGMSITHVAATPRPRQRRQRAVQLSQNTRGLRQIVDLGRFVREAAKGRNVGGTIHPFVIRLSLNDYAEGPMADDEPNDPTGGSGGGSGKKNWCSRIVAALMGVGIKLPDCTEQKDPDHFADLVETACLNADTGEPDGDELQEPEEETQDQNAPAGDLEQPPPGAGAPPGPPIQMSLTKQTEKAEKLARNNLLAEIADLERTRRVTPATAEDLRSKLKTIRLSFRKDDGDLSENAVSIRIEAFKQNAPGSAFRERSGVADKPPAGGWGVRNGRRVRLSLKTPAKPEYAAGGGEETSESIADALDAWNKTGAKM